MQTDTVTQLGEVKNSKHLTNSITGSQMEGEERISVLLNEGIRICLMWRMSEEKKEFTEKERDQVER